MPNYNSPKKERRKSLKNYLVNKSRKSKIKTFLKKAYSSIGTDSKEDAFKVCSEAQSQVMRGVKKKVLKLNTASRKVKKLFLKFNNNYSS